jgi:hypothetical protein
MIAKNYDFLHDHFELFQLREVRFSKSNNQINN